MPAAKADRIFAHGPEQAQLLDDVESQHYVHHAHHLLQHAAWEAVQEVELTDEMRYTVAAHAALLAAGFRAEDYPFHNVAAIILRHGAMRMNDRQMRGGYRQRSSFVVGLSHDGHGPLVLDWRTIERNIARPERGENVIYHEFAHKLDQLNGVADGMPPLPSRASETDWNQTLGTNYRRLKRRGSDGLIRAYGATNEAEYFAVTTEVFFTRPIELRDRLPRVYTCLQDFFAQDPAQRLRFRGTT